MNIQVVFVSVYLVQPHCMPIIEAARSKESTVFARSNTGIVNSNSTQGMDVCYSLFLLSSVGSGLATGWSLI
jgi:hypothetical protein